jgi:hypothetical protein
MLDRLAGPGRWQVELRTVSGIDEVIVYVAHDPREQAGPLLQRLVPELPPVTQFVLIPEKRLAQRLADHNGEPVLDGRSAA